MEPRRRFRFLKQLSEGTFGRVYMAEMITDNNFSSVVAIKLLHGKWLGHEEIVQRSRDEARVLGLLHHRNIIRVEDLTSINGQCAVIMEYLDGVDLKTLVNYCVEKNSRIPRRVAIELVAATVSALEAAYYKQPLRGGEPLRLIHRDIKPSNIMVTDTGDIKVLDFGTAQARFEDREAKTQALAFGSQAYMAPERLMGDPDAPSGDMFSLGVTLFEVLKHGSFGKIHLRPKPYCEAVAERLAALDLSDLNEGAANKLIGLLEGLLTYEPESRPNAQEVLDVLEDLSDEIGDGTLRRFCRDVVVPCKKNFQAGDYPNDPLAGSTLFEDISELHRSANDFVESGDSGGKLRKRSVQKATAEETQAIDEFPVDIAEDRVDAPLPATDAIGRIQPALVDEQTDQVSSPGSGASMMTLSIVTILVVLMVVLALGIIGIVVVPNIMSDPTVEPDTPEPVMTDNFVPEGIDGGRIELDPTEGPTGNVILGIEGVASVKIRAYAGEVTLEYVWNGTGSFELVGLPVGTYQTRITTSEGSVRTNIESFEGQTCTYSFVTGGTGEWQYSCE